MGNANEVIPTVDSDDVRDGRPAANSPDDDDLDALRLRAREAEEEVTLLRRRLQESPRRVQTLEEKLLETKGQLAQAISQNEKLTSHCRRPRSTWPTCGKKWRS
ncbi:MAG TPA: hypothetical protein VGY51_07875 [Acidimicrobiales bacterium]|nr:hypothetical protein [Acidimicrobiales bacterium]